MSTSVRTKNVWGRDIEPEYAARSPRQRSDERGVGIRIEGLAKSFGDVPVLHDLDLDVPAGQFLAIVGKSGCGKSTLLRLLVGLETPFAALGQRHRQCHCRPRRRRRQARGAPPG